MCFRSFQNDALIKCNDMKIGECIINDTLRMHITTMFYLFNGTYNGKPVNNTFMDDPPAQYGKHALFWGQLNSQFSQIQHVELSFSQQ